MNDLGRAAVAFLSGLLYLAISFVLGMQVASFPASLIVLALIALVAGAILFPTRQLFVGPLIFALPTLAIGLISMIDHLTFLIIGVVAFVASVGGVALARRKRAPAVGPNILSEPTDAGTPPSAAQR